MLMSLPPNPHATGLHAVLVADASEGHDASSLRLSEHTDIVVSLDASAADLLRALADRAVCDSTRKGEPWGDRYSLPRAYQRVFNAPISAAEIEAGLAQLVRALEGRGLELDLLIEKNRKTRDVRLSRPLRVVLQGAGS